MVTLRCNSLTFVLAVCHSLGMHEQNQIAATLTSAGGTTRLKELLAQVGSASRTEFGRRVCQLFGFHDARGHPQLAGCMKALRALDADGRIQLPAPRHERRRCRPRGLGRPVPEPQGVPARVDRVQGLELVEVTGDDQRRLWTELLQREHPRGAARHVGAQLRYLLVAEHGVLGALGFAAAALALAARDTCIGWDADRRSRQLHRVVALSRFLIRPSVRCQNLASKALGLCLRRLPADFERRYGYRPALVETFVEKDRHAGTSLAAANWVLAGETAGRGRFAPRGARVPLKAVYLYPLARNWRAQLGVAAPQPLPALGAGEGLARDVWAQHEFGGAPLGDVRLSKRLVQSAQMQSEQPLASFPGAAGGNLAAVRGHYRMIDQPAASEVTPENILAPHRQRTLQRMQGQQAVLCLQDGSDLNFAEHPGCSGLGLIGKNKARGGHAGAAHALDAGSSSAPAPARADAGSRCPPRTPAASASPAPGAASAPGSPSTSTANRPAARSAPRRPARLRPGPPAAGGTPPPCRSAASRTAVPAWVALACLILLAPAAGRRLPVVGAAAHVVVLDRRASGRRALQRLPVRPARQDRLDAGVADRPVVQRPSRRRFHALLPALPGQADDAQTAPVSLLRVLAAVQQLAHRAPRARTHRARPCLHPFRRPLPVLAVRLRPVRRLRREASLHPAAPMQRHPPALLQHFHAAGRQAHLHWLPHQCARHRVAMPVHRHVVVEVHSPLRPLGILVTLRRQRPQGRPVQFPRTAAAGIRDASGTASRSAPAAARQAPRSARPGS